MISKIFPGGTGHHCSHCDLASSSSFFKGKQTKLCSLSVQVNATNPFIFMLITCADGFFKKKWEGFDFARSSVKKKNFHIKVCQTGAWRRNIQEEGLPSQEGGWQLVFQGAWPGEQSSSSMSVGMKSILIATTVESNYCSLEIWRKIKIICGPPPLPLEISGNPVEGILVTS